MKRKELCGWNARRSRECKNRSFQNEVSTGQPRTNKIIKHKKTIRRDLCCFYESICH
jgi:hypothetical protein